MTHPCRLTIVFVSTLVLAAACVSAPKAPTREKEASGMASDTGVGDEELVRILSDARARFGVPAMAAALVTSRGLIKVGAIGTRKWGTDTPVTLDDLWHLGSDTKIMTSTLAAILIDRGMLKWTSTVSEVFPELASGFHPDSRDVTVLQLLSHRAGLPANLDYGKLDGSRPVKDQRIEAVREGLRTKPLSSPGTQFLYSNLGYIIVGAMIERVSGMDWESALIRFVFTPLEMISAGFGGLGTPGLVDQPWGHVAKDTPFGANGPDADNPPVLGPAGRVHCTIQDWARFIVDQLRGARGEPALLKAESYRMLQTPHFGADYALGWSVVDRSWAGGETLTHSGSNTMYLAVAWIAPKRDFAVLVCTNEGLDSSAAADEAVGGIIKLAERL